MTNSLAALESLNQSLAEWMVEHYYVNTDSHFARDIGGSVFVGHTQEDADQIEAHFGQADTVKQVTGTDWVELGFIQNNTGGSVAFIPLDRLPVIYQDQLN